MRMLQSWRLLQCRKVITVYKTFQHARNARQSFQVNTKQKGYLDTEDGDVGVWYTGNTILKPQAIGFL